MSDKDYFIDLLFYHLELRCYIVVELKAREFLPIDEGQLNFYLSAVDDILRKDGDNPTIGIILCQERDKIIAENQELNSVVKNIENEYKKKSNTLDLRFDNRKRELEEEFKNKEFDMGYEYKNKINKLEKENSKLHRIIDKFYENIKKFISWICKRFDMGAEDNLIRDFQRETNTFIDPEQQIKHEKEMERDLER